MAPQRRSSLEHPRRTRHHPFPLGTTPKAPYRPASSARSRRLQRVAPASEPQSRLEDLKEAVLGLIGAIAMTAALNAAYSSLETKAAADSADHPAVQTTPITFQKFDSELWPGIYEPAKQKGIAAPR